MQKDKFYTPSAADMTLIFAFEDEFFKLNRLSFYLEHKDHTRKGLFHLLLSINRDFHFVVSNRALDDCLNILRTKISILEKMYYLQKDHVFDSNEFEWLWTEIFKILNTVKSHIQFNKQKILGNEHTHEKTFYTSEDFKRWELIKDEIARQTERDKLNSGESFPSYFNRQLEDGFE